MVRFMGEARIAEFGKTEAVDIVEDAVEKESTCCCNLVVLHLFKLFINTTGKG